MAVTPRDRLLIRAARRRGGDAAAAKIEQAIRDREIGIIITRLRKVRAAAGGEIWDTNWPPAFVSRPVKVVTR